MDFRKDILRDLLKESKIYIEENEGESKITNNEIASFVTNEDAIYTAYQNVKDEQEKQLVNPVELTIELDITGLDKMNESSSTEDKLFFEVEEEIEKSIETPFEVEEDEEEKSGRTFEDVEADIYAVNKLTVQDIKAKNKARKLDENDILFLKTLISDKADKFKNFGTEAEKNLKHWIASYFTSEGKLKDLVKNGNMKLQTLVFDLPSGACVDESGSCPFDVSSGNEKSFYCPGCYAKKSEVQYLDTFASRNRNFELAKNNLALLEKMLIDNISRYTPPADVSANMTDEQFKKKYANKYQVCRIHSSGDFFNQQYADMWARVIANFPRMFFYAYTKTDKSAGLSASVNVSQKEFEDVTKTLKLKQGSTIDFSKFPSNFTIIPSFITLNVYDKDKKVIGFKKYFNYGNTGFIKDIIETYPNNNLDVENSNIIINEKGTAFPIKYIYNIKIGSDKGKVIGQVLSDEFNIRKDIEDWLNNPENKAKSKTYTVDELFAKKSYFSNVQESQRFETGKSKSYEDYDVWLCPATNPALRSKHLVPCGDSEKGCTYCTKKFSGEKAKMFGKSVVFWIH